MSSSIVLKCVYMSSNNYIIVYLCQADIISYYIFNG